jgi:hypothetical protein
MELAQYFERSPDHEVPGCRNTGEEITDGVVFPGIEVLAGAHCFVGRQSIYEAVGELHGITVQEVKDRMNAPKPKVKRQPGAVTSTTEIS